MFKSKSINLIADNFFRFQLNNAHTNNEAMSYLTDHIFNDIQCSQDPNLEEAKSLLKRVHTRDLYKFICSYNLIFVSIILIAYLKCILLYSFQMLNNENKIMNKLKLII